jgi:hypothetical protein
MSRLVDLSGKTFGRWTVVSRAENSVAGQTRWLCRCVCDNQAVVQAAALKTGHSQSCGCLKVEVLVNKFTTHGHARDGATPTYHSWAGMIARCTNENHAAYPYYGGSGITVCERWLEFPNFLADMGEKPTGKSIERRNYRIGYEPKNCCWATLKEQARNRRSNRLITLDGVTRTIAEWSEQTGIRQSTISWRLQAGRSAEEALSFPNIRKS